MILTILNAICLITLGIFGFIQWDALGINGTSSVGMPTEMLMPVFFGGAQLICLAFTRLSFRHGLYGGLIIAMLGIVSSLIRLHDYGYFTILTQPKSQIIVAMALLCIFQFFTSWSGVQKDRKIHPFN